MKKRLLPILLCMLLQSAAFAGRLKDSLLHQLRVAREDSNKAWLLFEIGAKYESIMPDSAWYYLSRADSLFARLNHDYGRLCSTTELAYVLTLQSKFQESLLLCRRGEALAEKLHDQRGFASTYTNMALNYSYSSLHMDSSIFYYLKAKKVYEQRKDTSGMVVINGNLTGVYIKLHQPEKGYQCGLQAIALCRAIGDRYNICNALTNTGSCLYELHRYPEAIALFQESLDSGNRSGSKVDILPILLNLDNIYKATGNYPPILERARKALELASELGDKDDYCIALQDLAFYHFTQKDYDSASFLTHQSIDTARANHLLTSLEDSYQLLGSIALVRGNLSDHFHYNALHDSVRQQIFSTKIDANTLELEAQYETTKKEQRIQLQAADIRRSRLLAALLTASLIAAICIIFLSLRSYRNRRRAMQREQELSEQKILQLEQEKQLNATEAVLQAQDEERTRMAKDLHDGLGGMLSGIKFSFANMKDNMIMTPDQQMAFGKSLDMLDASIGELRRVAHNMMPESLIKFGLDAALQDMCLYVNSTGVLKLACQTSGLSEDDTDKTASINIYRIVQELISNIIRHAGASEVLVQVTCSDGRYEITVEDNGHGFNADKQQQGMGLTSIRNRVDYMNGTMDIRSSATEGTSVFIVFKKPLS